jgi:predicted secreted protein
MPSFPDEILWRRSSSLAAALGAILVIFAGSAQAGDAAARRIIGFSPDGRQFAFEQYGTLDGSHSDTGWSEIAIIDTETNTFVGGNPVHVADESEEPTLTVEQARVAAAARAAPLLAQYAIEPRGERSAHDNFTFPDDMIGYDDIGRVEQVSRKWLSPNYDELGISTIQLVEILADSTEDCSSSFEAQLRDGAGKARGFRLTLRGQDGKPVMTLHEDQAIPASRQCPTSYSLSEAYVFKPDGEPSVLAVLVQRFSQGFEGRDRRFIAVTGQIR